MNDEYELFFYFEGDYDPDAEDHDPDDAVVTPMCVKCHKEDWGYLGWYYKGKLTPYKYVCGKCDCVIKDGIVDDQIVIIEE